MTYLTGYIMHYFQNVLHKWWVFWYILVFCSKLMFRAVIHDLSKFRHSEAKHFAKTALEIKKTEYGTDRYKELVTITGEGIRLHYARNSHHPEHYPDGFIDMSGLDRTEMVADWCAASRRYKNGNIRSSLGVAANRFDLTLAEEDWIRRIINDIKRG